MTKYVLVKPLITEKTNKASENLNKYSFIVSRQANKIEIKNAVEDMYGVRVTKVNTVIMPRKLKTRFTKSGMMSGKTALIKKAYVTVDSEDTIDFYDSI